MTDKTWKKVEREIAKYFPDGQRRGADFKQRFRAGGKSDVITSAPLSVEIKHSKSPSFGLIVNAIEQARIAREDKGELPISVIHKKGWRYGQSIVSMTLDDFCKFFLDCAECEVEVEDE